MAILRVGLDVGDLDNGPVLDCAADRVDATRRQRKTFFIRDGALRAQPVVGHEVDKFAVEPEERFKRFPPEFAVKGMFFSRVIGLGPRYAEAIRPKLSSICALIWLAHETWLS